MPYKCPIKHREALKKSQKKYYESHRAEQIERSRINKHRNRAEFSAFKARLSCVKCGENHPATLDFHHHTPNKDNIKISVLLKNNAYKKAIEEIMTKCIVLCSNCHRKHHYEERKAVESDE